MNSNSQIKTKLIRPIKRDAAPIRRKEEIEMSCFVVFSQRTNEKLAKKV